MLRPRLTALAPALVLAGCATDRAGDDGGALPRAPAPAEPKSAFAQLDGIPVHYVDVDAGPSEQAIVFVHGWACDHSFFRGQVPALRERGRLIAVDLPGHGESPEPDGEYSVELFARAIDAVLVHAGVERAVLVGHSNGAPVVRQFYRRHPTSTLALVLIEGPMQPLSADPEEVRAIVARFDADDYRETARGVLRGMLPSSMSEGLALELERAMLATPRRAMIGDFEAMTDPSIWTDDPIDVPVLIVNADAPSWDEAYEAHVRGLCPDLDYRVLEGMSHLLMLEDPERFNAILGEFLERIDFGG